MNCVKFLLTMIVGCALTLPGLASRPDTANPYFEMNRVMGTMATGDHLSFDAAYYYEQSNADGIQRDTLSGVYKVNGKRYFARLDSMYVIQNDFYNVSVNKKDSSMIIGRVKTVFPAVMNADVLNPTLHSTYLSKIVVSDSANTRKLNFILKDISPYYSYELVFDTTTYNMISLKYKLKHYGAGAGNSAYYTLIQAVFSNYHSNAFTDSVFDTSVYFKRANGKFVPVAPFETYDIFNQVMNQ